MLLYVFLEEQLDNSWEKGGIIPQAPVAVSL